MEALNLLERRPWHETSVPSMTAMNLYDLTAVDRGVELRGKLGDNLDTPWSSSVLLRASALQNSEAMLEMDMKSSAAGVAELHVDTCGP